MIEKYQKAIVDTVQEFEYFKRLHSSIDTAELNSAYQHFIDEIDNMIKLDINAFELAVLSLLNDTSEYLKLENVEIKLECAGIYGRRHFRTKIYRICYYFGVLIQKATEFLGNELIQLYQSNDTYTKLDIYSYCDLIRYIYEEHLITEKSKIMLKNIMPCEKIKTFEDLKVFLLTNSDTIKISRCMSLISTLENIAEIQNDGLVYWSFSTDLKTINDVRKMLLKHGFNDAVLEFDKFVIIITPIKKEKRQPKDSEIEDIQKISDIFLSKLELDAIDVISLKIADSLNKT